MENLWKNVRQVHVRKAIQEFNQQSSSYSQSRNTFLVYGGREYPAKHIRGIAYRLANGMEVSKKDYSGGEETKRFFTRLGFMVRYERDGARGALHNEKLTLSKIGSTRKNDGKARRLSVVSQKDALQLLLQKHYGKIETEKKYSWLRTPDPDNLPSEYVNVVNKLIEFRNKKGFLKANYPLSCDIVLEERKIIIEYDERQHFSKARLVCLKNYPPNLQLSFSKEYWERACLEIGANDGNPVDRDERRAYYDTVRDIEAYKNGYTLLRIKHGDFDWESSNSAQYLKNLVNSIKRNRRKINNERKIARLVISGNHSGMKDLKKYVNHFIHQAAGKHYEFIITPGGFMNFNIPKDLATKYTNEELELKHLKKLQAKANERVLQFMSYLGSDIYKKLQAIGNYITIGIDGFYQPDGFTESQIELVAVYDLKHSRVKYWTGKFYPTQNQIKQLVKINDLNSHFLRLNRQNVVVLGCHDLNVFNPRGRAVSLPDSYKGKVSSRFIRLFKKFKPDIVLQHPHFTDSPRIWNSAWCAMDNECPKVKHYASGIRFARSDGKRRRGSINDVLRKTRKGEVDDYICY